jgi:transcriptional regulator with XRE-family HTH domain
MKSTHSVLRKFGLVIRQERERQGLSQEKLAELAEVHRTYIGMIERAEKNITLVNIEKLSKGLKKPMSYLIKNVEAGPRKA